MHHDIKLRIEYADAVLDGSKNFEIRQNDRGYQKGDTVRYQTVDREGNHVSHRVEENTYTITYVLPSFHVTDGWVVFGTRLKYASTGTERFFYPMEKALKEGCLEPRDFPVNIGDVIYHVWVDGDHGCLWRASEALCVTGVAYQGFFTADTLEDPLRAGDFWKWDEFGVTAFRTRKEAENDAARRNTEESLPRKANG